MSPCVTCGCEREHHKDNGPCGSCVNEYGYYRYYRCDRYAERSPARSLPTPTATASSEVVAILESLLEDAKAGTLVDMLFTGTTVRGEKVVAHTPAMDVVQRLGMLELVKADWLASLSRAP